MSTNCQVQVLVAPLLARFNLLINRDIEWANLVLGFEKENHYAVVDVCYPQSSMCEFSGIREYLHGLQPRNRIAKISYADAFCYFLQLLHLRHPFAYMTDVMCNELSRVRTFFKVLFYDIQVCWPFWWITSSIYAEINVRKLVWFTEDGICGGGCMIYTSSILTFSVLCYCPNQWKVQALST
ncbi:hypothetical protein Patl1_24586 [Pistacia atlantica]|uniref:Uncharacterized protein n=1 Tax=Pistacia atlantica TaxID=434234 RepID=A0ACC1A0F3_9ROSI|nr:hypothetical protein Patl1_24586 [Pistacia atlantica]